MSTNKRVFDTNVQVVKYNVLKELVHRAYEVAHRHAVVVLNAAERHFGNLGKISTQA